MLYFQLDCSETIAHVLVSSSKLLFLLAAKSMKALIECRLKLVSNLTIREDVF